MKALNFLAGAGLGALVALLIALSSSPVVAATVTVVLAAGMAFLSLSAKIADAAGAPANDPTSALRIVGFSGAAIIFLFLGIYLRAHNALGESVMVSTYRDLTAIGVPAVDARRIVVEGFGPQSVKGSEKGPSEATSEQRLRSTSLFSVESPPPNCAEMAPSRFQSLQDLISKYQTEGSPWRETVELANAVIARRISNDATTLLAQLHRSLCSKS